MAFILDVDVARTKHIRLVDQKVKNLLTTHSPKCLTHLSDGLAVARFGNLNVVVDDLLWWIKAVHQHAVSTEANQIKFDRSPPVLIRTPRPLDNRLRCLCRNGKLIRFLLITVS